MSPWQLYTCDVWVPQPTCCKKSVSEPYCTVTSISSLSSNHRALQSCWGGKDCQRQHWPPHSLLILISLPLEIYMSGQTNSTLYGQNCSWAEPSSRCGGCRLLPLYSSNWPILAQGTSPLVCFSSPSFCTGFTAAKDKNLTDLYKIVQTFRSIYCPFQHLLPGWWVKLFWGHLERSRPEQKSWIVDYLHTVNHV